MTDIVDELRARALQGRFNLEAADEIERLRAELSEQCRLLGMSGEREAKHLAQIAALEKERDALRAELDALKSREGEVVYRWLALDYSGFCYGSNPPDNLPNRCNLKAFYAPAEVAP